jgi:hypothetical protein
MGDSKKPNKPYTVGTQIPVNSKTQLTEQIHDELFCFVKCLKQRHDLKAGQELWFKIADDVLQAVHGVEHVGNVLSPEKELLIKRIRDGYKLLGIVIDVKQAVQLPPRLKVKVLIVNS